ncbi:AarF/UbiB family protein, partial [Moorena sp. SIO3I6]|uniref:AarF/UbiB family protein n=1 Tax=Moorena sp. SIO3I6 TaxID=2607831 RepID=UPI0013FC0B2A
MSQYQLVSPEQRSNEPQRYYDPQAIARYYRSRPWLVIWRCLKIVWGFASFVFSIKLDQWRNRTEQNKLKRATQLRKLLTNLGPTFIKVGQALSTRPDLVRQDFLDELIKLQDQLPPFDNAIALSIIEQELGRSIQKLFSQISPRPVAAASLGQVYR